MDADRRSELAECKVDLLVGVNEQQICDKVMERLDQLGWQPVPNLSHWLQSAQSENHQAIQRVMRGTTGTISVAVNPKPCPNCVQHQEAIRQLRNALHGNKQIVERVRQILIDARRLSHNEIAPERFADAISGALHDLETKENALRDVGLALSSTPGSEASYADKIHLLVRENHEKNREITRLEQAKDDLKQSLAFTEGQLKTKSGEVQRLREENSRLKNEVKDTGRPAPHYANMPKSSSEDHL
jgi:transcription antitermination factor NusG